MTNFEKLGVFYLGRTVDPDSTSSEATPLLYDSQDLTTHAVCIGMTGSGKTGLGIGLIEEAAIDGIPSILIDPKGDLGNLLLTFPNLSPADFRPWVDEGEAARKQMTPDEFATHTAAVWKKGLAQWGQDGERIARLKASADFAIYTPASKAGLPLSILSSLDAPPPGFADDATAMRDRVSSAVTGLLALIGVEADPLQSREHILLSFIVDREWRAGRNLDLTSLVHAIQEPGVDRLGVLALESFFPAKDRLALAMRLNNLIASPGFAAWTEGEPLNIQRLLYTPEGKPRVSVLSISHLNDAERMFFVTVLLNEVLAWTRRQTGTSSLRALLYMDEIFGYFPPSANPPSKAPMLTLLKQARAFGLGVVLSTQNPVDLDYRGLSNTGTWLIGRLQTARDKMRVVEGLASATAGEGMDRAALEGLLNNLRSRVFLMRNVHDDAPVLFETRWCLSYLRGPLSPGQISSLMADKKAAAALPPVSPATPAAMPSASPVAASPAAPPPVPAKTLLPATIKQQYMPPVDLPWGAAIAYRPALLVSARLHYVDLKQDLDYWKEFRHLVYPDPATGELCWSQPEETQATGEPNPVSGSVHENVPSSLADPKRYAQHEKDYKDYLNQISTLEVFSLPAHKLLGQPNETEGDFRARASHALREKRDEELAKLRKKYETKIAALAERERRASAKVDNKKEQLSQQRVGTMINFGAAALAVLMGRRVGGLGRATTGLGSASRAGKKKLDVQQAGEDLAAVRQQREELEAAMERELNELSANYDSTALNVSTTRIAPRRSDTSITFVGLGWVPKAADS